MRITLRHRKNKKGEKTKTARQRVKGKKKKKPLDLDSDSLGESFTRGRKRHTQGDRENDMAALRED